MSPVNDAYHKKGLAPAQHRVEMCRLASETSDIVMVDSWEAVQPAYQRSLMVLQRLEQALNTPPPGGALTWRAQALCDLRKRSLTGWKTQVITSRAVFPCRLNSCRVLWLQVSIMLIQTAALSSHAAAQGSSPCCCAGLTWWSHWQFRASGSLSMCILSSVIMALFA